MPSTLALPPISIIETGEKSAKSIREQLTSAIAFHPKAIYPWLFYEEIEEWLGPWGLSGYPIGYGKFYCMQFNGDQKLQGNLVTRNWLRKTTVALQESIRDYIVGKIRDGSINTVNNESLKKAAFDSHPKCYDQSGLALVATTSPEMIPIIVAIAGTEFIPFIKNNAAASWKQAFETLGRMIPQVTGITLASLAGPAHTGIFGIAAGRDRQESMADQQLGEALHYISEQIRTGTNNDIFTLTYVIKSLEQTQFSSQDLANSAKKIITEAQSKRVGLLQKSNAELSKGAPEIKDSFLKALDSVAQSSSRLR